MPSACSMSTQNTIVFATTKEHSNYLETYLEDEEIEAISITSDTSKERREESLDRFKNGDLKVLINFGVLTTGFDAPKVNAIIIARPTTSLVLYSQMIGRGMRGEKMGGTKNCDIFNVIDNILNLPDMNQAYKYFQDLYS